MALGIADREHFAVRAVVDHRAVDGLPDRHSHLEFTRRAHGSPGAAPSRDNLLVLYVPDAAERAQLVARLDARGAPRVEPENPYWRDKSVTFEDPDSWCVAICAVTGV